MDSPRENKNKSGVLRGCRALEKMRLIMIKQVLLVNAAMNKGEAEPVRPVRITTLSEYKHTRTDTSGPQGYNLRACFQT